MEDEEYRKELKKLQKRLGELHNMKAGTRPARAATSAESRSRWTRGVSM